MSDVLLVDVKDGLATLTLNRPDSLNALSGSLIRSLGQAFDDLEQRDDVRVILVTGAPRADGRPCFCAGADLKELAAGGATAVGEREHEIVREVAGAVAGDHLGTRGIRLLLTR